MTPPKSGTLHAIVLQKLVDNADEGGGGICFLDMPPELGITSDMMDNIIEDLRSGDFEREELQ